MSLPTTIPWLAIRGRTSGVPVQRMPSLLTRLSRRSLWPELTSALAALAAAGYVAADGLREGFPLDDAWIHMVYGLGVVRGGSLS